GDGWRKLLGPEVQKIEELIAQCGTVEEIRDRLGELALSDPSQLTEAMARVFFGARVSGNAETGPDGNS
ncbi:MAG TPA: hypothetical protein VHO25_12625, partial [Polyangiaceae bacterium]|nr:hypothetical protein [Polyangiaceae bacterium]